MPRDGADIYSVPSGTAAVSGNTISSSSYNTFLSDLVSDLNLARPIAVGGTGATTAAGARTNLGVSASDATITAIAALDFSTAGSMMYSTAADTFSLLTSTAAGRTALTYVDPNADRILFWDDSAGAFASLALDTGLSITTTTMSLEAGLAAISALSKTDGNIIVGDGSTWVAESGSTARTSLGLGTAATQNTGTSGANVPLLNANNTHSGDNTHSGANIFSGLNTFNRTTAATGPAASGSSTSNISARIGASNVGAGGFGVDFGVSSADGAAWLQARNWSDYTSNAALNLNPNGGSVTVGGSAVLTASAIGSTVQAYDADLATWAGVTPSANGQSLVSASNYAAMRTLLDLEAGTDFYSISAADSAFVAKTGSTMSGSLNFSDSLEGVFLSGGGRLVDQSTSRSLLGANGDTFDIVTEDLNNFIASFASSIISLYISGSSVFSLTSSLGQFSVPVQARIADSSETSGALTSASANRRVPCSGNITLPSSGMTAGDFILIDPAGTARTVTRPAAHTMYILDVDSATGTSRAHNVALAVYHGSSKWTLHGVA